jgi:dual specificity MAP kinase phosphatase
LCRLNSPVNPKQYLRNQFNLTRKPDLSSDTAQPETNENDVTYTMSYPARLKYALGQIIGRQPRLTLLEMREKTHRQIQGVPTRRYAQVQPTLFVGGQHSRAGLATLQSWGVTAVLNLRAESDDADHRRAPERYLHLAVNDGTPPTLDQLQRGVDFITAEVADGGAVYVHCWEGVGRAPTMTTAYLVSTGLAPVAAWGSVRVVRPFIRPTPMQIRQIEQFAKRFATV